MLADPIGEKFASIQIRSRLQVSPMLRTGELLKPIEIDDNLLYSTVGKIADQVDAGGGPQCPAQLQQAVAQAMTRLLRTLVRPQQIREPLAADRLAALNREKSEQGPRLLWQSFEPTFVTLNQQRSKNADRQCHRYAPITPILKYRPL